MKILKVTLALILAAVMFSAASAKLAAQEQHATNEADVHCSNSGAYGQVECRVEQSIDQEMTVEQQPEEIEVVYVEGKPTEVYHKPVDTALDTAGMAVAMVSVVTGGAATLVKRKIQ
ncbi:MAG: hypothetical protein GF390_03735 [Candidatus Pacebacteria bacterium]|nr:hypothetical protein [Candidatus Paceibacterota bacterium]